MPSDPYTALGAFLTDYEARRLAVCLQAGDSTTQALKEIHAARRSDAKRLLAAADLGHHRIQTSVAVLRAVVGARSVHTSITPVWTMPDSGANFGRLTSEAQRIIEDARMSVVCSSYNFAERSHMSMALLDASTRPGVSVTVYLDSRAGGATRVAKQLPNATIYRSLPRPGFRAKAVSHAKFIIVDRALVLATSANFSYQAENTNIEFGLLVHDTGLAASMEALMRSQHGRLYEHVIPD